MRKGKRVERDIERPEREPSIEEQQAALREKKKREMLERVQACAAEISAVMDKYRCQFAPMPKYQLSEDGATWQLVIELNYRPLP